LIANFTLNYKTDSEDEYFTDITSLNNKMQKLNIGSRKVRKVKSKNITTNVRRVGNDNPDFKILNRPKTTKLKYSSAELEDRAIERSKVQAGIDQIQRDLDLSTLKDLNALTQNLQRLKKSKRGFDNIKTKLKLNAKNAANLMDEKEFQPQVTPALLGSLKAKKKAIVVKNKVNNFVSTVKSKAKSAMRDNKAHRMKGLVNWDNDPQYIDIVPWDNLTPIIPKESIIEGSKQDSSNLRKLANLKRKSKVALKKSKNDVSLVNTHKENVKNVNNYVHNTLKIKSECGTLLESEVPLIIEDTVSSDEDFVDDFCPYIYGQERPENKDDESLEDMLQELFGPDHDAMTQLILGKVEDPKTGIYEPVIFSESKAIIGETEIPMAELYVPPVECKENPAYTGLTASILDVLNPLGSHPYLMDLTGPYIAYIHHLYCSKSMAGLWLATYQFGKALGLSTKVRLSLDKELRNIIGKTKLFEKVLNRENLDIESESFSDNVDGVKLFFNKLISSEIAVTLRDFFVVAASWKIFDKDISHKIFSFLGKPLKMSVADLINSCFDALKTLLRVGEAIVAGTPISNVLFSPSPISTFMEEANNLLFYKDKLFIGRKVEYKMCRREFYTSANKLVEVGEDLIKKSNPLVAPMNELRRIVLQIRQAIYEVDLTMHNNKMRSPPVGVILHGHPGIGKSNVLTYLVAVYAKVKGIAFDPSHIYHRCMNSPYWECYDPISQWCIHFSEGGNVAPDLVKTKGDLPMTELTTLIDGLPMTVDMAFEGKGKVSALPEMTVIDSNNEGLNLDILLSNPAATRRRFLYVEMRVKQKFRKANSVAIDIDKSLQSEDLPLDRWTFDVYLQVPEDGVKSLRQDLGSGVDIFELTRILKKYYGDHITAQERVKANFENIGDISPYEIDEPVEEVIAPFKDVLDDIKTLKQNNSNQSSDLLEEKELVAITSECGSCNIQMPVQLNPYIEWAGNVFSSSLMLLLIMLLTFMIKLPHAYLPKTKLSTVTWSFILWLFILKINIAYIAIFLWLCRNLFDHWMMIYGILICTQYLRAKKLQYTIQLTIMFRWNREIIYVNDWWVENGQNVTKVLSAVTCMIVSLVAYKKVIKPLFTKKEKKLESEAHSEFKFESDYNQPLNNIEEGYGCGTSYKRIPINGSKVWNTKIVESSRPVHTDKIESLSDFVNRNVRSCYIQSDTNDVTHILGISGNYGLINTHSLGYEKEIMVRVSSSGRVDNTNIIWRDTLVTDLNRVDLGNDISIIALSGIIFKDIVKHIAIDDIDRSVNSMFVNTPTRSSIYTGSHTISNSKIGDFSVDKLWMTSFPDHKPGMCGIPLYIEKIGGCAIGGIHAGGAGNDSFSTVLDRTIVMAGIKKLESSNPYLKLNSESGIVFEDIVFEDPMPKSLFRYEMLQGVNYYGKKPGNVTIHNQSKLVRTGLETTLVNVLYDELDVIPEKVFGKPMMQPHIINGEYISPYNIAMRSLSSQKKPLILTL